MESREQLLDTAHAVKRAGASMLRGGAYKPRTSPYDFQGLGMEALKILREAREETGLPVVTEVMSTEDIDVICEHVDMLQVGARNMQNFALLRRLATSQQTGSAEAWASATVKEWLLAAEYLLSGGNRKLCCASAASRRSKPKCATPSTSQPSHWPATCRICQSLPILRMELASRA